MPKKIRELEAILKKAGFIWIPGKGSHRKWRHASGALFVMRGRPREDAKPYQEKGVAAEIEKTKPKK